MISPNSHTSSEKEKKKKRLFLLKESAKKIVSYLRNSSPFFSEALHSEIFVTKKYLQHILYVKKRDDFEIEERLILSSFLDVGIKNGTLFEKRKEEYHTFYELHYPIKNEKIGIIILEEKGVFSLVSSFLKYKKKHFV